MTTFASFEFRARSAPAGQGEPERLYSLAKGDFGRYEVLKDLVDECIDLSLNYRQSGHPGGSRSKVHMLLALSLSGAMRWDIRRPWLAFSDRLVLSAGHTAPAVYASLAVLNEGLRTRYERTGQERYAFPDEGEFALTWEALLGLRHRGGLPGHAEMARKSLVFKYNTGPSGHGLGPATGEALALKLAGAEDVKVFVVEGEGGLTPGGAHEAKHSAWGLGLCNLVFLIDWNDFGIDPRPASSMVRGTPAEWFSPYGWRTTGTEGGSEWGLVTRAVLEATCGENPDKVPSLAWFKTRKGRGYGKHDAASHGTPWPANCEQFWAARKRFMERYGVQYQGVDEPLPAGPETSQAQAKANLEVVMGVLRRDEGLVDWLSDRLVAIAHSVPERIEGPERRAKAGKIFSDRNIYDFQHYPAEMWKRPGEKVPNRAALAAWGAYVNSLAKRDYGRPLFIACSADLALSTNIAGFGDGFGEMSGWGWYEKGSNPTGALLPTEITEFTNAGMMAGLATVNLDEDPFSSFEGFWGAFSTYGAFSYLKYGPVRLFSQLAQDCELKVGKLLWVAGHSGPETAEDSRTHFGVFAPGVTQLFPEGQVVDLHPWEYNEVPVVLGSALALDVPVVALHLTRPAIEIPDREALGLPSHFAAARGAYVLRPFEEGTEKGGTVFVRGTMTTHNLLKILPELSRLGLNVKVVAAVSLQLFRAQDASYRESVVTAADYVDSMVVTNGAFKLMHDWAGGPLTREYSLSPDFDDRWRTGGTIEEVMTEAHLDPESILGAIKRFVTERPNRLHRWRQFMEAASQC